MKRDLARSNDKASDKRDEVVAKATGYEHGLLRGDGTKVAHLAGEVMSDHPMG